MGSPMKVLVLGWEYPPAVAGGLGAACHGLTTALAARGHAVQLALPDTCRSYAAGLAGEHDLIAKAVFVSTAPDGSTEARDHVAFHPYATDEAKPAPGTEPASRAWGAAASKLYGSDLAEAVRAFTRHAVEQLADLEFDVIHAHDWMTYPAAIQLRLAAQRPACLHVHSTAFDRGGSPMVGGQLGLERGTIAGVERAGVRMADAVAAVSGYTKGVLIERFGADADRVHVVHNAPGEGPAREAPGGRPQGPPTVFFLGRLTRQKGVGFLLRAASMVLDTHPTTRFLIAGDGEERQALIETAAELGLARNVFFMGAISDEAKLQAYRDADVFALPSVSEPFGLTPLEALAEGTPVVLSRASGVAETIPSAPSFEPWDVAAMAASIVAILDSRGVPGGHAERLVTAGQKDLSQLSWDRSAAALESALACAMSRST